MQSQNLRPRHSNTLRPKQSYVTPSALVTAASIGLALILLVTVFVGDWLKAPGLQVSASHTLFSPNNDGSFDLFDITYDLNNSASTEVLVFAEGRQVRRLETKNSQPAGKYFLTWDGRDQNGAILPDGAYQIQITAQSAIRKELRTLTAQIDNTPPTVQLLNSTEQMRVNTAEILLEGITEPRAMLWWNGAMYSTVDASGRFTLPVRLQEGPNALQLRVIDEAGNVSEIRREIMLVTRGPELTLLRPTENEWTNQQVLEVQGRTTPGGELTINQQKVPLADDGSFRYQIVLNPGTNLLHIEAKDELGNISSLNRTVYFKTGAANIELNIEDGATITESTLTLVGKVEPGSRVNINGQPIPVGLLGDFQIALPMLEGQNIIEIESIDQAGNISRVSRSITYASPATQSANWNQVSQNFNQAPWLIVPALVLTFLILGFLYWQRSHVKLSLSLNQTSFVPGMPENNVLEIYLDLSQTARVTLEILDEKGYPRATLLRQRRKMGRQHILRWDGRDDQAEWIAPGVYTVRAEAGSPPLQVTCSVPLQVERPFSSATARPISSRQTVGSDLRR